MSIDNIIKYIEDRNKRDVSLGHDSFGGWVCDAMAFTNSEARTLTTLLLEIETKPIPANSPYMKLAELIYDKLHKEYGDRAEQFATDNAPLSQAEQRFYDAKPAGMSDAQWEAGVKDGEL